MTTINDLASEDVAQAEELLVQMLEDEYPSMDLAYGRVLRELLIRPAALFHVLNDANMTTLRDSMSLLKISQNPTLASSDIVDGVLSNLGLFRDDGAVAAGQLRIILASRTTTVITANIQFTAGGLTFTPVSGFVGVLTESAAVTAASRLIVERGDGLYEFLIDVKAVESGDKYNITEGTELIPTPALTSVVKVLAAVDFSGGRVTEDNAALAARAQLGLSPRVLSGRTHIETLITDAYPDVQDMSIIGYGDIEMHRDAHNMFGVSHGGKVDIYVKTAAVPHHELVDITATAISVDGKTLSATLDRDVVAGAYDILAVYRNTDTPFVVTGQAEPTLLDSLPITNTTWTHSVIQTGDEFVPDIASALEAAYTRYRQLIIQFTDAESTLALGDTDSYKAYLLKMPDIASIQDFVNARARRAPAADYVVRAPVPVICAVGLLVEARNPSEVDVDVIKLNVATQINRLGFSVGHLPGSKVIDAAQEQLPMDAVLNLPLTMTGTLYLPDGTRRVISGTDELRVPSNLTDSSVTARTVAFFLRTRDIDVGVVEIETPET